MSNKLTNTKKIQYYATFKDGERVNTYILGLHKNIPKDAIPVDRNEMENKYWTNKYVRNSKGKPVLRAVDIKVLKSCKTIQLKRQILEFLKNSDYQVIKHIEGVLKNSDYKVIKKQRDDMRKKYNAIDTTIDNINDIDKLNKITIDDIVIINK